jgi:hypothetical protein
MRNTIICVILAALCGLAAPASAQNCTKAWDGSIRCDNGTTYSQTWSGGTQSNGGTTWSQSTYDNGWNSNTGGSVRQNWSGGYQTGGGTTWSQSPLGGGWNSSGGRHCTTTLLDNVNCR